MPSDSSPTDATPPPTLRPAPECAVGADGVPFFGGYAGLVSTIGFGGLADDARLGGNDPRSRLRRAVRRKAWVYVFAATPEISLVAAMVNGAITGTGFLMVTDLRTGTVLADSSRQGALARINDRPGDGLRASYRLPGTTYRLRRERDAVWFSASLGKAVLSLPGGSRPWLDVELSLHESGTGITAVSEVDHGRRSTVSVTGKTAGLSASGQVVLQVAGGTRTLRLDGGLGGYDYTSGFLPRRTAWRWAYAVGRVADGITLGLNLSEGFSGVGERTHENTVWVDGRPRPLDRRARFAFDRADLLAPWRITTVDSAVRLVFEPVALHSEHLDVRLVSSHFRQPVGHFRGEIDVDGHTHVLDRVPGVVEDQDIVW